MIAETIYFVNTVTKKDYLNQERTRKSEGSRKQIKTEQEYLDSLDRVPSSPERRHCCHPVKKTILMLIEDIEDFEEDDIDD